MKSLKGVITEDTMADIIMVTMDITITTTIIITTTTIIITTTTIMDITHTIGTIILIGIIITIGIMLTGTVVLILMEIPAIFMILITSIMQIQHQAGIFMSKICQKGPR
jgi:hypothetical protein